MKTAETKILLRRLGHQDALHACVVRRAPRAATRAHTHTLPPASAAQSALICEYSTRTKHHEERNPIAPPTHSTAALRSSTV